MRIINIDYLFLYQAMDIYMNDSQLNLWQDSATFRRYGSTISIKFVGESNTLKKKYFAFISVAIILSKSL